HVPRARGVRHDQAVAVHDHPEAARMNEQQWRAARDSRSMRYAGRVLDPERPVLLRTDAPYAARYDGQVAVLTAANLLARMTPAVALDIPAVPLAASLPWAGRDLKDYVLQTMFEADP